jgi:FkbM family methyltransferase
LNNVIALNYAAYSREEQKLKLYLLSGKSGFTSYNTILSNFVRSDEKFVEVNANTLDYLLHQNGIDAVNWIKIDVEGAEFEVLKGATSILSKSKDIVLLIELHDINYDYRPKDFIKSYNFRMKFEKSYQENEIMHMIIKKSKIPQFNKNRI